MVGCPWHLRKQLFFARTKMRKKNHWISWHCPFNRHFRLVGCSQALLRGCNPLTIICSLSLPFFQRQVKKPWTVPTANKRLRRKSIDGATKRLKPHPTRQTAKVCRRWVANRWDSLKVWEIPFAHQNSRFLTKNSRLLTKIPVCSPKFPFSHQNSRLLTKFPLQEWNWSFLSNGRRPSLL